MPTASAMSLGQVCEQESDSWVNDPFEAQVGAIEQKVAQKTGKKFWVVTLLDVNTSAKAELAVFTAPKFVQGDVVEVGGKGVKFVNDRYGPKISMGRESEIHVVRRAAPGGGQANGSRQTTPPTGSRATPPEEPQRPGDLSEFHRSMKKMALFYLHAMRYAADIDKRFPFVTPEQQQACVSTLFIEGCRRQLVDIVPALDAEPPKKAAPPPPPPPREDPVDEDVPF